MFGFMMYSVRPGDMRVVVVGAGGRARRGARACVTTLRAPQHNTHTRLPLTHSHSPPPHSPALTHAVTHALTHSRAHSRTRSRPHSLTYSRSDHHRFGVVGAGQHGLGGRAAEA